MTITPNDSIIKKTPILAPGVINMKGVIKRGICISGPPLMKQTMA
ncbi:MAG: hypothetical protein ACTSV3_00790 [Candidatus Thorarchaeota archaeon]